ncbi:MAG: hypothetical protein V3S69_06255 [Dehalococcoidales bacterium]
MSRNTIGQQHALYDSVIATVATTLTITGVEENMENHYIGVRYYSDAAGTPVTPTAGTVVIAVLDEATNQWTATAAGLTSTDVTDKQSHAGNVIGVRATPTGILTATHWQLFSSSNL